MQDHRGRAAHFERKDHSDIRRDRSAGEGEGTRGQVRRAEVLPADAADWRKLEGAVWGQGGVYGWLRACYWAVRTEALNERLEKIRRRRLRVWKHLHRWWWVGKQRGLEMGVLPDGDLRGNGDHHNLRQVWLLERTYVSYLSLSCSPAYSQSTCWTISTRYTSAWPWPYSASARSSTSYGCSCTPARHGALQPWATTRPNKWATWDSLCFSPFALRCWKCRWATSSSSTEMQPRIKSTRLMCWGCLRSFWVRINLIQSRGALTTVLSEVGWVWCVIHFFDIFL